MSYVMMVLIAVVTMLNGAVQAQNAQLSGVIALPAPQASALARQTPGYRSRLGGRGASASVQRTSFSSVIISAHPLSFKAEVQPLAEPVRMTQEKIAFVPHIVPITAGTTVEFVNLDKVFHNVFSLTPGAKFNIGRKPTGDVVSRRVDYVGRSNYFAIFIRA